MSGTEGFVTLTLGKRYSCRSLICPYEDRLTQPHRSGARLVPVESMLLIGSADSRPMAPRAVTACARAMGLVIAVGAARVSHPSVATWAVTVNSSHLARPVPSACRWHRFASVPAPRARPRYCAHRLRSTVPRLPPTRTQPAVHLPSRASHAARLVIRLPPALLPAGSSNRQRQRPTVASLTGLARPGASWPGANAFGSDRQRALFTVARLLRVPVVAEAPARPPPAR